MPEDPPTPVSGAVLVGGASRRMGTDKARLTVGGRPMLVWVRDALAAAGAQTITAVGRPPGSFDDLGVDSVADLRPAEGPLGGLHAALEWSPHPVCLVVSVDVPQVQPSLLASLVSSLVADTSAMGVVAESPRGPEPLLGVWRAVARSEVGALLDDGRRSMQAALERLEVLRMPADSIPVNVNAPDDLRRISHISSPEVDH